MLTPGAPAPNVLLPTDNGPTPLASFAGKPVVLFFFPKADTPGCSIEAKGFRDAWEGFVAKGVVVLGVSKDKPAKQAKWKAKECFPFSFVSDESGAVCEAFGAWREKSLYGRAYMGIARITVLVDADGKIARVWDPVKPAGHAEQVLAAL